jgi:hypothetical protein
MKKKERKMIYNQRTIFYATLFVAMILSCSTSLAEQRLEMDGTAIIGNKELPKVLYIVPWKSSEAVSMHTPAFNSVLDETFQVVERSSFKRELEYYDDIYASPDGPLE